MLTDVISYIQTSPSSSASSASSASSTASTSPPSSPCSDSPQRKMAIVDDKVEPPAYNDIAVSNSATPASPSPAVAAAGPSNISEIEWQIKLKKLEKKTRKYNWNAASSPADAAVIVASMRDLAASHRDPEVRAYWNERADAFERAPDADKGSILKDVGKAIGVLIVAPFAIAGAILVGTGMLLQKSGNLLSGNTLGKMSQSRKSGASRF